MQHHNWFLAIFERYIVSVTWIALVVAVVLTGATYFIEPIYSIKTELCLDASLEKILPDIDGVPSTKSSDYIREEYFAINSVNLMQQPEIAKQVIISNKLTDDEGEKISADDLVNPSLFSLLFSNNGYGVSVKWISDTQQFSITGYGKSIDAALSLSSQYADAFLSHDKRQFRYVLENLKERQEIILNKSLEQRLAVEKEQITLIKKYGVADWEERLSSLTAYLASTEEKIATEELAKVTASQRAQELRKQIDELKNPVHSSIEEKKSDMLASLQSALIDLKKQLAAAAVEYTPQHPEYNKIKKSIEFVAEQMANEQPHEYSQSSRATSSSLDTSLTNLMQLREEEAIRDVTLDKLLSLKKHYISELNFTGEGYALYSNLTEKKSGLNLGIRTVNQHIIEIESLIQKPFSFFRIVSKPYYDLENVADFKYFPKRKLILIFSFLGTFFVAMSCIFIRELHVETLFYAWQTRENVEQIESVDIIYNRKKTLSVRHVFSASGGAGRLIRIRKLDHDSHPEIIARIGAEYFSRAGESTLLVDNMARNGKSNCQNTTGLHSWLIGNIEDVTNEIRKSKEGYDILCDAHLNSEYSWTRGTDDIRNLFSILTTNYHNVILLDSAAHYNTRLAGDALVPDIDILTLNGGTSSIDQTIEAVQHEKQLVKSRRTILLVLNNHEAINLFSAKGWLLFFCRFAKIN